MFQQLSLWLSSVLPVVNHKYISVEKQFIASLNTRKPHLASENVNVMYGIKQGKQIRQYNDHPSICSVFIVNLFVERELT